MSTNRRNAMFERVRADDWWWQALIVVLAIAFLLLAIWRTSASGGGEILDGRPPVSSAGERGTLVVTADDELVRTGDSGQPRDRTGVSVRSSAPDDEADPVGERTESSPATTAASSDPVALPSGPRTTSATSTSATSTPAETTAAPAPAAAPPAPAAPAPAPDTTAAPAPGTTEAPVPGTTEPPPPDTTSAPVPSTVPDPTPTEPNATSPVAAGGGKPADWVPPRRVPKVVQP